jgi:hypothetical protein
VRDLDEESGKGVMHYCPTSDYLGKMWGQDDFNGVKMDRNGSKIYYGQNKRGSKTDTNGGVK